MRSLLTRHMLTRAPRISTTVMRLLASISELAYAAKIVCTDRCIVGDESGVPVACGHRSWLGRRIFSDRPSRIKPFEGVAVEQTVKIIDVKSKAAEFWTE
jgi:hypothetical protein